MSSIGIVSRLLTSADLQEYLSNFFFKIERILAIVKLKNVLMELNMLPTLEPITPQQSYDSLAESIFFGAPSEILSFM